MVAPNTDYFGYPVSREWERLEDFLSHLAGMWTHNPGEAIQEAIVVLYGKVVDQLYVLGWDKIIQIDDLLLEELMPESYLVRHPLPWANPTEW